MSIDEAAQSVSWPLKIDVDDDGAFDELAIPACGGVVVFRDTHDETSLLATTGDVRAFVRRRFSSLRDAGHSGIPIRRILVHPVASSLEADCAYLDAAREFQPVAHQTVVDRWRSWFLAIAPDAKHPVWITTDLFSRARTANVPDRDHVILGPFRSQEDATRYASILDDVFDLCRYPRVLRQTPHGQACAYYEMGRCPAPCDGSESLARYRERVHRAIDLARSPIESALDAERAKMQQAANARQIEEASIHKQRLSDLQRAGHKAFASVHLLERFRWLFIGRGQPRSGVRCLLCLHGRMEILAELDPSSDAAIDEMIGRLEGRLRAETCSRFSTEQIETIGLMSSYITGRSLRSGSLLSLQRWEEQGVDRKSVKRAIQSATRVAGDEEIADRVIDGTNRSEGTPDE